MSQAGCSCTVAGIQSGVVPLDILNSEPEPTFEDPTGEWSDWFAEDDVKGGELPPQLVHDARVRELSYLKDRKVYEYSSVQEAIRPTGRKPLRLK